MGLIDEREEIADEHLILEKGRTPIVFRWLRSQRIRCGNHSPGSPNILGDTRHR